MLPTPIEARFDTLAAYRAAMADLLVVAKTQLAIFDTDLSSTQFDTRGAIALLVDFLRGKSKPSARVVLHDFSWLQSGAPRLLDLFRNYGHLIEIRRCPENLGNLTETFAIADGLHLVARFHIDHDRGKYLRHDPDEVEPWCKRFDELWGLCYETLPLSNLGL